MTASYRVNKQPWNPTAVVGSLRKQDRGFYPWKPQSSLKNVGLHPSVGNDTFYRAFPAIPPKPGIHSVNGTLQHVCCTVRFATEIVPAEEGGRWTKSWTIERERACGTGFEPPSESSRPTQNCFLVHCVIPSNCQDRSSPVRLMLTRTEEQRQRSVVPALNRDKGMYCQQCASKCVARDIKDNMPSTPFIPPNSRSGLLLAQRSKPVHSSLWSSQGARRCAGERRNSLARCVILLYQYRGSPGGFIWHADKARKVGRRGCSTSFFAIFEKNVFIGISRRRYHESLYGGCCSSRIATSLISRAHGQLGDEPKTSLAGFKQGRDGRSTVVEFRAKSRKRLGKGEPSWRDQGHSRTGDRVQGNCHPDGLREVRFSSMVQVSIRSKQGCSCETIWDVCT